MTYADDKLGQALQIKELLINECCSNGEILNEALDCEDVEKKDNIDVIANSIAVDELLKPVKMNPDNILSSPHYRSICSDDKFEGRMYALMLCPCTVTTCIQKCCLEGEYFDTAANICAPLKDDVSGFQPQLHQIKNESSNNTPYYLTEGSPKCGNSLERLQLNITRAYPQESGWLMLDDVGMGRYVFYERGK
nr:unnamed protein product [Callosobruchus chinensis]